MPNSLAAKLLITVIDPVRKLVIATAMVTEITNRHSCSVDVKHAGRALGSWAGVASSASFSAAAIACNNEKRTLREVRVLAL